MKHVFVSTICIFYVVIIDAQTQSSENNFFEDFNDTVSVHFRSGSTGTKAPFKVKFGQSSTKEPSAKVLSFKIDPNDSAGAGRGPEIISKNFTHFGTYSSSLKVPDVRKVQPNVGAVVGYFTYHM